MQIARVHSFCLSLMCNQGGSGPLQPAVQQLLCSQVGPVTDSAVPVNDLKDVIYLTLSDKFAEFSSVLRVTLSSLLLNSFLELTGVRRLHSVSSFFRGPSSHVRMWTLNCCIFGKIQTDGTFLFYKSTMLCFQFGLFKSIFLWKGFWWTLPSINFLCRYWASNSIEVFLGEFIIKSRFLLTF